jgi:HK97 family phage major capsid protein
VTTYDTLKGAYDKAQDAVNRAGDAYDALPDEATQDQVNEAADTLSDAADAADRALDRLEVAKRQRAGSIEHIREPDMYERGGKHSFLTDLFGMHIRQDPASSERLSRHQAYEVEKRAITSTTLGGLIPPQYLVELYAKAPRNGRVFADQCNVKPLGDVGMNLIIPRLTTGTAADVQATENTTVATQDIVESDLTVPVRTIAGYVPVSRQGIERGYYNEEILFEDLVARYWARLDTGIISDDGNSGTVLGLLHTTGIKTSAAIAGDLIACFANIADVIQQINTAVGGLGYYADKIVMHPRRWGFFEAALDSQNRPLFGVSGENYSITLAAEGEAAGYGYVGRMHGLPVYIDANIPTNGGAGTNQDSIIVMASRIVHLWEQEDAPITLAFEQQAGNQLQTQLVAYGYAAFTAGRYPAGAAAVTGAGLVPPTF